MKYLDPKADLTFKRIFGEHPDLVISLLNALLPLKSGEEIAEIEYLPPELVPENPLRKYSIVDVRCCDKQGRQFLVEMQMLWSPEFHQRILFNASKAYVRQLDRGKKYDLLQPVYSLNLVNNVFEPTLEGYYHHYKMVHVEHSDKVIDGLELILVELPKFQPQTFTGKRMQALWLRFLTEIDESTRQVSEDFLAEPEITKALTVLEESAFSDAEMAVYDHFWDMISVERILHEGAIRRGLAEGQAMGLAEGKAKGLAEGLAKGMAEGQAMGLAEGQAKGMAEGKAEGKVEGMAEGQRLIAGNLKQLGLPLETIAQSTGLSIEEINRL